MPGLARISAIPSEAEATLARETKQALSLRLSGTSSLDLLAMDVASEPTIRIPATAARLLVQILDEMGQGNLMAYKRKLHADRLAALAELSAYDQELGI